MKKILLSILLVSSLFFISPTKAYAISAADVQNMINTAIAPLQAAITDLQNRVSALEISVANLLTRVTNLDSNIVSDFSLPNFWNSTFTPINRAFSLNTSPRVTGTGCAWNGVFVSGSQVQVSATAHLPGGDVYGTGSCDTVNFTNVTNFPNAGTTFPVDLNFFWQGKLKHQTVTVTVPQPTPTPTP